MVGHLVYARDDHPFIYIPNTPVLSPEPCSNCSTVETNCFGGHTDRPFYCHCCSTEWIKWIRILPRAMLNG